MPEKKKILFVISSQFGYHTDTLMYCKYLNKDLFDVHYIGFNLNMDKVHLPNVNVHYVSCHKNKLFRYVIYFNYLYKLKKSIDFDLTFHVHTKFSVFIRLLFLNCKYNFDIRTGDISDNSIQLTLKNFKITLLSKFSKHISIISEGLANKLKINNSHILPLGGETHKSQQKNYSSLRLLYVGTLSKRRIQDTIEGINYFLIHSKNTIIKYDIVGSGSENEVKIIKDYIQKYNLQNTVFMHGQIKYTELENYYNEANVGIVYIPQKEYYQFQPSTKLYEFLLAGMPVIATNTYENKKEIDSSCGIICEDNPLSFSKALSFIYNNSNTFISSKILNDKTKNSWENIVKYNLEPYLNNIINS